MGAEKTAAFFLHILLSFLIISSLNRKLLLNATDTISRGQSLSGNQTIISKTGKFELGFFTRGNSRNYYIGIWYKNIRDHAIIWVANRESPVTNPSSSKLTVSETGNLALYNTHSDKPVWSSNSSFSNAAVLLDTGNLILINGSNSNSYIWQSFDHPTDTLVPGGWLGVKKITGEYQRLTSWKNSDDPAPGLFALSMDPDGSNQYVLLWNGSNKYWTTGLWNGQYFSNLPTTKPGSRERVNVSFIDNKDKKFVTYKTTDSFAITRSIVDTSGQLQQYFWLSSSQQWQSVFSEQLRRCDVYSLCGPYGVCDEKSSDVCQCSEGFQPASVQDWALNDWRSGCSQKSELQCGSKDGFLEKVNVRLPAGPENLMLKSAVECKSACMSNCSCDAYAYDDSRGCSVWKGDLRNLQQLHDGDNVGGTLFLRLLASDIPASSESSHDDAIGLILGVVFGAIGFFCIVLVLALVYRSRKRTQTLKQVGGSLIQFRHSELQRMTKNFSEKLGSGGFGTVFKGRMPDSTSIAIKKLEGLRQGEKQFRAEVTTLGSIQHVNLVRLRGFCYEGSSRLIVYDYMSEGSLDSHLFHD